MITFVEVEYLQTSSGDLLVKEIAFLKEDHAFCYLLKTPTNLHFDRKTLNYLANRHGFRVECGYIDYSQLETLIKMHCNNSIVLTTGEEKCKLLQKHHQPTINAKDLGVPIWKSILTGSEKCDYHGDHFYCALRKVKALKMEYEKTQDPSCMCHFK